MSNKRNAAEGKSAADQRGAGTASDFRHYIIRQSAYFLYDGFCEAGQPC